MPDLDLFEQQLADRLHAHDLPVEMPGLADATVRRGVSVRRRRRAAWGTALAALLVVPGALWTTGQARTAPVPTVAAPPPVTAPRTVDLSQLTAGPPPKVGYVLDGVWHRADGSLVPLTAARRSDGAVSWVPYGDHLFVSRDTAIGNDGTYSLDGGPEQSFPTDAGATAGVAYAGPDGSVLAPSDHALLVLDRAGRWHRYPEYATNTNAYTVPQASRDDIWTSRPDNSPAGVVQRRSLDSEVGEQRFPQWSSVTTADSRSDQVAVLNDDEVPCGDIVDGSTGVSRWHSCDWSFRAFSPDGRYAMATGASGAALLDIGTRSVLFRLPPEVSAETDFHFATDDSVAFVVDSPTRDQGQAVATCDVDGTCQRSTDWSEAGPIVVLDQ